MVSAKTLLVLLCFLVCIAPSTAQIPRTISLQLYLEESGTPFNGWHDVSVSWFTSGTGGTPLHEETFLTLVVEGVATVELGSVKPLPNTILQQGPLWLGIEVDAGAELIPRTPVLSVPYALMSERSLVAERLAPEVTGVVTSVNEIAGAVNIETGRGLTVERDGQTLRFESQFTGESGIIAGTSGVYEYSFTPLMLLAPTSTVIASVESASFIGVLINEIDLMNNVVHVVTSAPLLDTERIRWHIVP